MVKQAVAAAPRRRSAHDDFVLITEFCQTIFDLTGSATSQAALLEEAGVSLPPSAFLLLRYLDFAGSLTVSHLAEIVGLHPSTVSSQIRPLTSKRLVRRTVDRDDRRVATLSITPAGRAVCDRIRDAGAREWSVVLARWTVEDRAQLAELLRRAKADVLAEIEDRVASLGDDSW
jgi:DNA-binding MarR family transcriptional regulator